MIAVSTGGFKGNSYYGYDETLQTLFRAYVQKNTAKSDHLINIWGLVPGMDPFFRGDLAELKRLLQAIGLQVNTFFGYDQTIADLETSGAASHNVVLSRTYGLGAAKVFAEEHGTPYLSVELPIGPSATAAFLREVASFTGIDRAVVEETIGRETDEYYQYIDRAADLYLDADMQHYAIIVGNANYSFPIARWLARGPRMAARTGGNHRQSG